MLKRGISLKHKPNKIFRFRQSEWLQFASLLSSGNTMLQSLRIMGMDTDVVSACVAQGDRIDDLIVRGQKGRFFDHLIFFLPITSLHESIFSAHNMRAFEKECTARLWKKCTYPLFIFIMSSGAIYMFTNFIIPQLLSGFDVKTSEITFVIVQWVHFFSLIFLSCLAVMILVFIVLSKNIKLHRFSYSYVVPHIFLCKEYISFYLCGFMSELGKRGLSSKDMFRYMKSLRKDTYLSYVSHELNDTLIEGIDLQTAIQMSRVLDQNFKLHFAVGLHNMTMEDSLQSHITSTQIKWDRLIFKVSFLMQAISYTFVAVLLVCVYQIMLIPLEMLNQF